MSDKESVTVFQVGDKKYDVVTKGIAQARQVARMGALLGRYGVPIYKKLSEDNTDGVFSLDGVEVLTSVLSTMDEDALISMFIMTFGCTREVAEEYFDIELMIDGMVALYNHQPAIQKLVSRFFSNTPSSDTVPEK